MPFDFDWEVIVVGGGAGGATFAYACARAGKRVLLLERGRRYQLEQPVHDERAMLIDRKPYDDRTVEVNGAAKRLYVGGVLGGGSSLYGGALLRPSKDDFHPGKHYGHRLPRPAWEWPIAYDDLEPYYTEAERLYGVAGCAGGEEDFGPLQRPPRGYPRRPLPLHPINQRLMAANRAGGLRPFRLPLAIDPDRCLRCAACAGYICPTGARSSSAHLVEQAVAAGAPLSVRTDTEVERLELQGGKVTGISLLDRATGRRTVHSARRYVLAAGAIESPCLLLRSGLEGPLVGRHYMFHLSPLALGIFARPTGGAEAFVKQVGFTDFYFGTPGFAHKMGLVQSLPVPGPLLLAKTAPALVPRRLLEFLRRRLLPLAGTVEDLPNPANRVCLDADGRPRLRHRFGRYDLERGRQLGRQMARILKRAGAVLCLSRSFPSDEHVAHQCGTLRFGTDPAHAVLDPDCRLFGHPNVFVVDGSFFPTSLGVGPALTIMANALRVAAVVTREL
jgi:choline dehydrogenase-like flavoprotein